MEISFLWGFFLKSWMLRRGKEKKYLSFNQDTILTARNALNLPDEPQSNP